MVANPAKTAASRSPYCREERKNSSARTNAAWPGGTATGNRFRRKHIIVSLAPVVERSLKAMETKIENSAAGTVTAVHAATYPYRKLARYQFNLAILDTMLRRGELSETDHATACSVLACHYGLDKGSIFR